ncbi:MAG TPA: FGGY-family carbohydrate kinase [Patescibacteria group bacterium]|nr:FGGY-family carbohydrate kinase [Patescibacteria group bacterium]
MSVRDRGVLVGIDAGGSYVKAAAFDVDSGRVGVAVRRVPVVHPAPGHNERDPEALWQAAAEVVRGATAQIDDAATRVAAVGVTAHGNGLYLVDRRGSPTRAAIQASDTRASSIVRQWELDGIPDRLRPTIWNGIWPGQPGPLLAWLAANEPETLQRSSAALMCGDYMRARLTSDVHAEITAASCNGLVDSTARTWSNVALEAYGINSQERLLPGMVQPADVIGTVTARAAELTGLPTGVPVVAGVVDNVGLHLGAGVLDGSRIVIGAGTWSINQLLVPEDEMTLDGALGRVRPYAACLAVPEPMAMLIEASATSASVLGWALHHATRSVAAAAEASGEDVYAYALRQVAARPPRLDAPLFMPYLDGARDEPMARGGWVGLSSSSDEIDLIAAVVEGVCFEHRRHVDRLSLGTDRAVPLRLAGGASRSATWAQLFADVTARPVEVSAAEELGAVGAAIIAGASAGHFRTLSDGVASLNATQHTFQPDAAGVEFRALRFETYLRWARIMIDSGAHAALATASATRGTAPPS